MSNHCKFGFASSAGTGGGATDPAAVRGTDLTGLNKTIDTVTAADTVLSAFGKLAANVENLEGKYVRCTRFATISAGTGTVAIPANNNVVLDDFGGTVDAVASGLSGGKPTFVSPRTSAGAVISTTFDANGNYVLSGIPAAYPVCIIYRTRILLKNFDDTNADLLGSTIESLDHVKIYSTIAAAEASTEAVGTLAYVVGKVGFYEYCDTCSQTVDHDLILSTSAAGTTRWVKVQTVKRGSGDVGWVDTDGATISATSATNVRLTVSSTAVYAVKGLRVELPAGTYDCTISGVAGVKFIYFDDTSKVLKFQDTVFDFAVMCPVSVAYWSGTAIVAAPQTEFHGIRDIAWHKWAHNNIGTQYKEGLLFTGSVQPDNTTAPADGTVQYLWSTTGKIVDEDVESNPGVGQWLQTLGSGLTSTTAAIFNFFFYNGSFVTTNAAMADRTPFIHGGGVTFPYWNNLGVLQEASDNRYIVYHYFATPMTGGWSVFARPHNAEYTTLALALAARPAQLTWSNYAELKHLYTAIFRTRAQFTNVPHRCKLVSLQDFRLTAGSPVAGISATDHQALSNRASTGAHPASAIAGLIDGGVQFHDAASNGLLSSSDFVWNNATKIMTVSGRGFIGADVRVGTGGGLLSTQPAQLGFFSGYSWEPSNFSLLATATSGGFIGIDFYAAGMAFSYDSGLTPGVTSANTARIKMLVTNENVQFPQTTEATTLTNGSVALAGGLSVAKNIQCKNAWLLAPRSDTTVFDANNWISNSFAATKWIDGTTTNINLPLNAGMIHQFDSLFGIAGVTGKYRVQEFTAGNRWWKRSEGNGFWQPWRELTMV